LDPLRILLIGQITPYLTTLERRDSFIALGHHVETIDTKRLAGAGRIGHWLRVTTLRTPGIYGLNHEILETARRFRPDVIWIEKGTFVFPSTMRSLRHGEPVTLVYHNTDDWKADTRFKRLYWRYLLRSLPLYDVHITSNLHNVEEFRNQGFPEVHHMELAANSTVAAPDPIPEEMRAGVAAEAGFVGHWEPETERLLLHLVKGGVDTRIFGGGWERPETREALGDAIQHRRVMGPEYAAAIQCFDVNIGIVSSWNRNHTASRTFQIPALGGFLLHQRNPLVRRYFREGEEAEFFDSGEELLEKCRHYLSHPEERRRIAAAGQQRCIESGYFEIDRVRDVLPVLEACVRASRERQGELDSEHAA
jgi:hypothetical protein